MDKKAVFLGECMIELSGDISSLDKISSNMQVNFGGDAYNSSDYFSRLANKQVSTFFSTALSNDTFSRKMIDRFKREKIKCNYIRTDGKNPPGLYSIEMLILKILYIAQPIILISFVESLSNFKSLKFRDEDKPFILDSNFLIGLPV